MREGMMCLALYLLVPNISAAHAAYRVCQSHDLKKGSHAKENLYFK